MPELHGAQLPSDGLHVAIRWRVADQPSRDALVLTPDDVGGLLFQDDVQSLFTLINASPVTWSQIPDGESTLQAIIAINTQLLERVVGPAASNDNAVPVFDGSSGKLLKESLASIDSLGNLATPGTVDGVDVSDFHSAAFVTASASALPSEHVLTAGVGISLTSGAGTLTITNTAAGASAVQGPLGATDTAIALFDGSTGALIKESLARVDNLGNITTPGTVDGVDVGNLAVAVGTLGTASYITFDAAPTLVNERVLTAGPGITLTPGPGVITIESTATGGAPADAEYLVSTASAGLSAERVLTAGANITLTPSAGALTIASTGGGGAPTTAQYLTLASDATLTNERVLTAGTGVTFTDGGAGAALTVTTPSAVQGPASALDNQITRYDGTTGKLVQAGANTPSIDDSGNIVMVGGATVDGVDVSALSLTVTGLVPATYLTLNANGTLTNERILTAGTGVTFTDAGAGGALTISSTAFQFNTQTGTAYTLVLADAGKLVELDNTSPITLTIPANASVAFPSGTIITVLQTNTGQITVGILGETLVGRNGFKTAGRWAAITLTKRSATQWLVTGDSAV